MTHFFTSKTHTQHTHFESISHSEIDWKIEKKKKLTISEVMHEVKNSIFEQRFSVVKYIIIKIVL